VGLFRRRTETLNEQLLREAGLEPSQMLGESPPAPPPQPLEPPTSVLARAGVVDGSGVGPNEWDATAMTIVPGLVGSRAEFTTLPSGDVIVSQEDGSADLSPLADAIEQQLSPPYRAVASRQRGELWGVGAKRIQVAEIPFSWGSKLELAHNGNDAELRVDGESSDEEIPPELEQVGGAVGERFYVQAERIDGDLWEVRATAL
jgi:hypothetical protein